MAFSAVDIGTNFNTSGATVAVTIGAGGVPSGATILVAVSEGDNISFGAGGSVADTAGNTYSLISSKIFNNEATVGFMQLFHADNVAALVNGNAITFTKQGTPATAISAMYVTGVTSTPLDSATTNTATGSSTTPSVVSGTPGVAGELIVGFCGWQDTNAATYNQDSGHGFGTPFTSIKTSGAGTRNVGIGGGNLVDAGTGTKTFSPTLTASNRWGVIIVGLKPGNAYSLTSSAGAFVLTGVAATLSAGKGLLAAAGAFTLTGIAATLKAGHLVTASAAAFVLTGTDAALKRGLRVAAAVGAFTLTGIAATLAQGRGIFATGRAFTITGTAIFLNHQAAAVRQFANRATQFVLQSLRVQPAGLRKVRQNNPSLGD